MVVGLLWFSKMEHNREYIGYIYDSCKTPKHSCRYKLITQRNLGEAQPVTETLTKRIPASLEIPNAVDEPTRASSSKLDQS